MRYFTTVTAPGHPQLVYIEVHQVIGIVLEDKSIVHFILMTAFKSHAKVGLVPNR